MMLEYLPIIFIGTAVIANGIAILFTIRSQRIMDRRMEILSTAIQHLRMDFYGIDVVPSSSSPSPSPENDEEETE